MRLFKGHCFEQCLFIFNKNAFLISNQKGYIHYEKNNETQKHDYRYHNTELLLKKYRDVVWSIEVSLMHSKLCFELEMECSLEEFVSDAISVGADLTGTNLHEHARTMERNKKMLHIIDASINTIKEKHPCGDLYYWILYFSYLSPKPIKKIDDIIDEIEKQGHLNRPPKVRPKI